jgi:pyruvate dehydrogenase E2 component (dihydrolipoamide acetyltransferase)
MATPVIMPRQGQSVESCIFSEWLKSIGEEVKKGDLLFAYETDKAAFEAEAPEDGILLAVFAEPGDAIPVLQNIAVIGNPGEDVEPFKPGNIKESTQKQVEAESGVQPGIEINDKFGSGSTDETKQQGIQPEMIESSRPASDTIRISPRAKKAAGMYHINVSNLQGSGPEGRIIERDIIEKTKASPRATPLARSISYEDRVDLPISGTGPQGKILAGDVKKVKSSEGRRDYAGMLDYQDKKITNIRRIIAENMLGSLQNTAQLTLHASADARKIKSLRKIYKMESEKNAKPDITINDLVCYAAVQALAMHSEMNVHFLGDTLRYFKNIHLGFAVDTERGLMVPTLKDADQLSLENMSLQLKELARQAQSGKISPELLTGATFTITNLGAYKIEMFTPVLNPPQIGILGLNTIKMHPEEMEDGSFGFIPKIGLSLTFDHRAVDGAPAAAFLRDVILEIENIDVR